MSIGCYAMARELVSIGSTIVDTRNVYCRRQRSKFCIERYSGCVVSTICDTLCFVIKTQTILSGHTEAPVFCVDYSRPAGKEGGRGNLYTRTQKL